MELRLSFRDERGKPVAVHRVRLLASAWGDVEFFELPAGKASFTLPLDDGWLRQRWRRFDDQTAVALYLEAPGYAAKRSSPFIWPGRAIPPGSPATSCDGAGDQHHKGVPRCVMFGFPGRPAIRLDSGATVSLQVIFRRQARRQLELVDDDGKPVAGLTVRSFVDWTARGHCGGIAGGPPLGTATSGSDGRLPVVDGDFQMELVFTLSGSAQGHIIPAGTQPGTNEAQHKLIDLTRPVTRVRLHRFRRLPLAIRFTRRGLPAAGAYVGACLAGFPSLCAAGCGPLGTTDADGWLRVPDFYPEEYESVWIGHEPPVGAAAGSGPSGWSAHPRDWFNHPLSTVDLSPSALTDSSKTSRP